MTVRPPLLERPTEAQGPTSLEVLFKEARRRRRRRWAIGTSAVLLAAGVGAAVGLGGSAPGRPRPAPPTTSEVTYSPKRVALPPAPACSADQLSAQYKFVGVGMDNVLTSVVFTNAGPRCRLSGYPTLIGVRPDGERVSLTVKKYGTYGGNLDPATLETGQRGLLLLGTLDACTANASPNSAADAANKAANRYTQLIVVLPKTRGSVAVPGSNVDVACGISESQLGVRPPPYGAPLGTPGTLTAVLRAPAAVRSDSVLHYELTLYDPAPERVVLGRCPRYTESISKLTGFFFKTTPGTKSLLLRRSGVLPCAQRRVIAPGRPQTFVMAIPVPSVRTIMTAVVSWHLEVPSDKSIEPTQVLSVERSTVPSAVARFLCEEAFGRRVVNSAPATVGAVRRIVAGTFVGDRASHVAAWCWTGRVHLYKLYAIAAEYRPVFVEEPAGPHVTTPPRPGPPRVGTARSR